MNDLYLIEPYNAYQKPPRKKHWMEIVEEEELFNRIIAEQQALKQSQNLAHLSQTPQPSSQQVQDAIAEYPVNAGAIGIPSDPYNNILYFSGSSLIIPNPSGSIIQDSNIWVEVHGHNCLNLTGLNVNNNQLVVIDLKNCNILQTLDYGNNTNLSTTVDLSTFPLLSYLDMGNTNISVLDVNKNLSLQTLYCDFTGLSTLDISKLSLLSNLSCAYERNLSTLDISKNPVLQTLYCNNNYLSTLDISKNPVLQTLYCGYNNLTQSSVDDILAKLVAFNIHGGFCDLSDDGTYNAAPSEVGLENVSTLQSRSWKVYTN